MGEFKYRLSAPDRTGVLFGLTRTQVLVIGAAIVLGVVAMSAGIPPFVFIVTTLSAGVISFVRADGGLLVETFPLRLYWHVLRRSTREWSGVIAVVDENTISLPPPFEDQELLKVDGSPFGLAFTNIAVVHCQATGLLSASVRVSGRQFTLAEGADQDRLVAMWGRALSAFCQDASPVVAVRWIESAAPAGVVEQRAFLTEQRAVSVVPAAFENYQSLLLAAGPISTRHETLVSLLVSTNGVSMRTKNRIAENKRDHAVGLLLRQLRLFTNRLEQADLVVSAPLAPADVSDMLTARLQGDQPRNASIPRTLLDRLGPASRVATRSQVGSVSSTLSWDHWRTGELFHRSFLVVEWPRQEMFANWMQDLVLYGASLRSIAVEYEPVSPRKSRLMVTRQAAKLESDAQQREGKGFRIDASHQRTTHATLEREQELVAGHGEFHYAGVVTVTGPSLDALNQESEQLIQVAAASGVELRPLNGRHDQGVMTTLPLAWRIKGDRS